MPPQLEKNHVVPTAWQDEALARDGVSREEKDLGIALQTPPGSQASPRGEAKDCALLSSRDADLLEPTESPQGNPSYSSVWREDSGLLSRPGRKRRPSAREDGGISGVSSSCGAHGGFLPRHDEDLREPLVRRQGSQVCMREVRGSASLLSSPEGDKGLILPSGGNHVVFLELRRHSRVTTGISAFPLGWPWEAQSSPRVARESWVWRSSHCRA